MITYISILRGINVGGHNKIKMDALKEIYVQLGYENVQTYIQSGNLIFNNKITDIQILEKDISDKILSAFGFEVTVFVMPVQELNNAIKDNPYSSDPAHVHLTFLSDTPDKKQIEELRAIGFAPDEFRCSGKIIYIYCPTGYGKTKLNNTFFEKKLKLTATTRNLNTCTELVSRATN